MMARCNFLIVVLLSCGFCGCRDNRKEEILQAMNDHIYITQEMIGIHCNLHGYDASHIKDDAMEFVRTNSIEILSTPFVYYVALKKERYSFRRESPKEFLLQYGGIRENGRSVMERLGFDDFFVFYIVGTNGDVRACAYDGKCNAKRISSLGKDFECFDICSRIDVWSGTLTPCFNAPSAMFTMPYKDIFCVHASRAFSYSHYTNRLDGIRTLVGGHNFFRLCHATEECLFFIPEVFYRTGSYVQKY